MSDNVMHIPDDVGGVISKLREILVTYKSNIMKLENLILSIDSSSSWKDQSVKASFVTTANSYIAGYKMAAQGVENYITFLVSKSGDFDNLESRFS